MEVEEPSEKLNVFVTRGPKESKTVNGVKKPVVASDEKTSGEDEKEKKETTKTRVVYSRDDLTDIRDSPAAKLWPAFAEDDCVRNGVWDPEVWHHTPASVKRCASPVDDIKRQIIIEDSIVLSPQRQSFGQGCHVPQSAPERGLQQERTKTMMSRTIDRDTRDGRSRLTGRVGRGSRSLDYRPTTLRDRKNGDVRQTSPWERERNDKDIKRSKDENSYGYKRGRKRRENEDTDPEWMTFGPTSQLETIELRGFNKEEVVGKRGKTGSFTGSSDGVPSSLTVKGKNEKKNKPPATNTTDAEPEKEKKDDDDDDADFDINQFFMSDNFLQFSEKPEQNNSNESRFCQFFGIGGGHGSQGGSRRSSAAEELLEYSGVSSGSPSTPQIPSPSFMFTPIKPVQASAEPESLTEMLQKTKLDVKPLLDSVLTSGKRDEMRIKGLKRLEDIEQTDKDKVEEQQPEKTDSCQETKSVNQNMTAFIQLVENMKSTGNLPEKPQPVIPGLPSHLLPRPPSPKSKPSRQSPSALEKINRSSSPVEFLHLMMQRQQSPSPPQVVPQMNRPYSPVMETPLYKPVDMLRRSPSPLNAMYNQKTMSPLLTPEAFMSPSTAQPTQVQHRPSPAHPPHLQHRPSPAHPPHLQHRPSPDHAQHVQHRPNPMMYQAVDKPRFELPTESPKLAYYSNKQTPKPNDVAKPKPTPKTQSSVLKDLGFMPTSVLQKIKKDQKTPRSKAESDSKPNNDPPLKETMPPNVEGISSPEPNKLVNNSKEEKTLLKPTAFKPYQGSSPHSVSPLRSGVHSEPQSPASHIIPPASPHHPDTTSRSVPVTPQRHPLVERHLLMNLDAHEKEVNSKQIHNEREIQERHAVPQPNFDSFMNHGGKGFEDNTPLRNDGPSHHPKLNHDTHHHMPIPQHMNQQQQQHLRREEMHNFANHMGRPRSSPMRMMGGHDSPQSLLGSPGLTHAHFPMAKPPIHPNMRPLHPSYFRMMPPTRNPSGIPLQSPAPLMQMMPQQHRMMIRPGHTPMPVHHGYGPINPQMMPPMAANNYSMQRPHPGYRHHQGRVPNAPSPDSNPGQFPSNDNALSKWFSDDVLKGMQSSNTKIPAEMNSKKILSVEDLERQQSLCTALTS